MNAARAWRALSWIVPFAIVAGAWEFASRRLVPDATFLPSLATIAAALRQLCAGPELGPAIAISLLRTYVGLALAIVAGVGFGSVMARYAAVDAFFAPIIATTYSLPKTALVPLFILLLGIGTATDVVSVFLACLLPVVVHTYHGVKSAPRVLIWSAEAMGTPAAEMFRRVLLPAALPEIVVGVRVALGFSYVVTIAAEMIASNAGIGKLIFTYGEGGAFDYLFAVILIVVLIAYAVDAAYVRSTDALLRWHLPPV